MGGKNHQPCNKPGTSYLKYSTLISRSVSKAHMALEEANIHLEDVLLAEMEGKKSFLNEVVNSLSLSEQALGEAEINISALRADMTMHHYVDLPTLYSMKLESLGADLAKNGLVSISAWDHISLVMKESGFYGMLDFFETSIKELVSLTQQLGYSMHLLEEISKRCGIIKIVEENQHGNIKVDFARLYTTWGNFNAYFLASSMLSTELWYAYILKGLLLEPAPCSKIA